ncbi:hypothetical protein KDH_79730 [Dictyobacter sp. S3.2.2.5]|uniref:Uncharacterized protein n=1 Tax=Dictyobacter halimunensis TaxID=3026934 RepID=A0ABQ6G3P5_9CHLR|nr:hypothetical protein KDH_79730 [Dictyobacter sp. S3.2.2.5]
MAKIKEVIRTYQARCEQAVLQAEPESAEFMAYTPLLDVFKKHQNNPDPILLMSNLTAATVHRALPLAEREVHVKARQAQQIAQTFVGEFQQDAGLDGISFRAIIH